MDGRTYAMTDTGLQEIPIYNIVLQFNDKDEFPEVGVVDRVYIDTTSDVFYYWKPGVGYQAITAKAVLHTLTFGAGEEYKYDGSKDVTVPVYLGSVE